MVIYGKKLIVSLFIMVCILGFMGYGVFLVFEKMEVEVNYDVIFYFLLDWYFEMGDYICDVIVVGYFFVCIIDCDGVEVNWEEFLKGYLIKIGYDCDEWLMVMCEEGGVGVDICYILFFDNCGVGLWVGN